MKRHAYEITQVVEMSVTLTVSANNASAANEIALQRIHRLCVRIAHRYKQIGFGDISEDYAPAREEESGVVTPLNKQVTL